MLNQSLIEARIIEAIDLLHINQYLGFVIPLSSRLVIIRIESCTRKVKNHKRRTLEWILRMARRGRCTIAEKSKTDIEFLENPLYIASLTKDDLTKILGTERKELINEIYNETFNT